MPDLSAASSPPSQSQQGNSSPVVQHGVVMNKLWPIQMVDGRPMTLLRFYFVDGEDNDNRKRVVRTTIRQSDRDEAKKAYEQATRDGSVARGGNEGPPSKKSRSGSDPPATSNLNPFDFVTWEDCANVKFQETIRKDESDIRITFTGNGFNSAIGTDAQADECQENSMVLAGLADTYPPSEVHRRSILHEFGHALGLEHEHQGPAAQKSLRLRKTLIRQLHGEQYANDNFLDPVEDDELRYYTNFDPGSIMTYRIPKEWQKQRNKVEIGLVLKLSNYDQACIKLMYPPDPTNPKNHGPFIDALVTVDVEQKTAGEIIRKFTEDSGGSTADRLTRLRDLFGAWMIHTKLLHESNLRVMSGIDPASLGRSGIYQFVGEVTKNKLFQGIIKNIVYRTMVQHGIPTKVSIPGAAQAQVKGLIAALSMYDEVGQLVRQHSAACSAELGPKAVPDRDLPGIAPRSADIMQCILDFLHILRTSGRSLSSTGPLGSHAGRFNKILPALLQLIEMVESGDPSEEPFEQPITQEELDDLQQRLTAMLSPQPNNDVSMDIQRGLLIELPGIQNILGWFSRTVSEGRTYVRKILSGDTNKILGMLRNSPPQNIFHEVYSLCFASTFVHDVNGTQKDLQTKLQELLQSLLPAISAHPGTGAPEGTQRNGWELVWGPVVWKVTPDDDSGGPDLAWYIAYNGAVQCGNDDEPRPTYVIAIAGTQTRSVHTWLNSNFDVTSPIDFKSWVSSFRSNPYELKLPVADIDLGIPYIARGTASTVGQLLTVAAPSGAEAAGQSLLDFLRSQSQSKPDLRLITTGHSLGGALSPTLALVLVEVDVIPRDRILTYPIAGPSPGNDAFAALFSETFLPIPAKQDDLESQRYQVWNYNLVNEHDPVPQAWCSDERACPKQNLQNIQNMIPGSYAKVVISAIISDVLSDLTEARVRYMPIRSQIFSARPSESFKDVRPQHTEAYHKYVGITPPDLLEALH